MKKARVHEYDAHPNTNEAFAHRMIADLLYYKRHLYTTQNVRQALAYMSAEADKLVDEGNKDRLTDNQVIMVINNWHFVVNNGNLYKTNKANNVSWLINIDWEYINVLLGKLMRQNDHLPDID